MQNSPQDVHKKVLGKRGEKLVEEYLKTQGCKILKRNYRTPFGEADLVVADGDEVAFVEVKARTSEKYGAPREAVGQSKQRRYRKIAEFFWWQTGEEPNARFDVAEVYADGNIEYFKYAY
ncbi:MAG: YraN family protein [Clostridia bacterium]|nr:YraN family protein [Clostridia bacterium]